MTKMRSMHKPPAVPRLTLTALLASLLGAQVGCTREFFREWANQDVSEAVFEKSRDPRWRLDVFSIEPPALSRFADPYDPDAPPAPPDDPASEALSPVPQWPDNRLMVPVEGTGYLDLLEFWQRQDRMRQEANPGAMGNGTGYGAPGGMPPAAPTQPPGTASPFAPPGLNPPAGGAGAPPANAAPSAAPPGAPPANAAPSAAPAAPPGTPPQPPAVPPADDRASFGRVAPTLSTRPATAPNVSIIRLQSPDNGNPATPAAASRAQTGKGGTRKAAATPNSHGSASVKTASTPRIPPPSSADRFLPNRKTAAPRSQDRSVAPAAFQNPSTPAAGATPAQAPAQVPGQPPTPPPIPPSSPLPSEKLYLQPPVQDQPRRPGGMDPNAPQQPIDPELLKRAGSLPPGNQAEAQGLATILVPIVPPLDEAEAMGLPRGFPAYKIGMQQAWLLALLNGRFYQYNLEALYLSALAVTQQRFAFQPQLYAGLGSTTPVPGGPASTPGVSTGTSYSYGSSYSPTGPASRLSLGTMAGVGKLFNSGGQLLMGFANEVVFNFLGKNPKQPTVLSAMPMSFVQPFLKGGGRAVTLEPLTLAERALLYQVREFALFRQQYFVVTLTAGTVQNFGNTFTLAGFSVPGNSDPTVGFIPAVVNIAQVEIGRKNVRFYENLVQLYNELIQGEGSGLSQLQVDQVTSNLVGARQTLFGLKITYRQALDGFKMQLGMPPDTPLVIDQHLMQPFYDVFNGVDNWQRNPNRTLEELPDIIKRLPELEDIDVEGRSVLGLYRNYAAERRTFKAEDEDPLEDELQAAVRIALEYRLDLMNARAQLYDAWRQIRVTANALQGVLNLTLTNNFYTPVNGTEPLNFLSKANNLSLVLNAELPLVRMTERNNFRSALISYQRSRRALQQAEDNLKIQLRNDLRNVHTSYIGYEIAKRIYELNVRLKDQAFEQIVAPPAGGTQALAQSANAAAQTLNLLTFQTQAYNAQQGLVTAYQSFEQNRLIVYRDIGTLPYDEWEAFSELFPSEYNGPLLGQRADAGPPGFTPPGTPEPPAQPR